MITQPDQIQSLLEELAEAEEVRLRELKKQQEDLMAKLSEQKASSGVQREIVIGDNVTIHIGSGRFAKVIRSTARYEDLLSMIQNSLGSKEANFGFRDDQGRSVWIRTTQDVRFLFRWYFAQELAYIQCISIPEAEVEFFNRFSLRKELTYSDGMAVFKCECAGSDRPLIFLAAGSHWRYEDGMGYLESIFGKGICLMFVDESEDRVTIDSADSWEYCIEIGVATTATGNYSLLLIESPSRGSDAQ
jgi:hypothetical protein